MEIKTFTWNIGGGMVLKDGSDPAKMASYSQDGLKQIIDKIRVENPDVITLQETHNSTDMDQVKYIADKLGYEYYVHDSTSPSHISDGFRLGHGIISRYQLLNHTTGFFNNPNVEVEWEDGSTVQSFDKGYTTCEFDINDQRVAVTTLHLTPFRKFHISLSSRLGRDILRDVAEKINANYRHWIVQGDFNIDDCSLLTYLPALFTSNVEEVINNGPTTPKNRNYDHVLYRDMQFISSAVLDDVQTDHYPVVTSFILNEG